MKTVIKTLHYLHEVNNISITRIQQIYKQELQSIDMLHKGLYNKYDYKILSNQYQQTEITAVSEDYRK